MDRTSELPTEILHNILSRLSTKTAARTRVLSKPWLKACSTNPHLSFDESDFNPHLISFDESGFNPHLSFDESDFNPHLSFDESDFQKFQGKFLRIVDNTLERYRHEKLPISTFKLCISFSDQTDCDGLVDKWLDIVAEKEVSHVALLAKCISGLVSGRYTLSAYSIFAMESLQELELNRCKLLKLKPLLFDDSKIKCRNLKSLTLRYVSVSESILDSILSCCSPHIKMISLHYCFGFSRIRISNPPNLLSLNILCCPIEEVQIVNAPKLLSFEYVNKMLEPYYSVDVFLRSLNIGTCQNLRRVEFAMARIDDTALFQLIQKLPFIKELSLRFCKYLKILKISSSSLEVCSIETCECLVQAIFDVPKLLSLVISDQFRMPSLSFEIATSQCRISIDCRYMSNAQKFIDLRRFLVELNGQPVDLTFPCTNFDRFLCKSLRESEISDNHPIPQVENFISVYPYGSYLTYFDIIFWTCRPKSLVVQCNEEFRKFLRQQLLKKYQWRFRKCTWNEYLINAQIEYKRKREDIWVTLDRSMLRVNPGIIEEIVTIRFS